jgi:predicted transcriptional regulator
MHNAKQKVMELLAQLPDDCSFEDIQYHLYVRQKVEQGLRDADEGRTYTQEEVEARMAKWLGK